MEFQQVVNTFDKCSFDKSGFSFKTFLQWKNIYSWEKHKTEVLTKKTSLNYIGINSIKLDSNQIYLDYPNEEF